jgi:predicted ABC-type sugar transport system permease subunit
VDKETSLAGTPVTGGPGQPQPTPWLYVYRGAWSCVFLVILVLGFEAWARIALSSSFILNPNNIQSILLAATQPLLVALGMTLIIIAGGIDLSVAFTVGLASVVAAQLMLTLDGTLGPWLSMLVAIPAAVLTAMVPGLVNGFLVARLGVPPFIATLGMYGVARGGGYLISGGHTVPADNPVMDRFGNGALFGLPVPVLATILVVLVMHYVLAATRFGQYTFAMGGSRNAAIRAGINVKRHTVILYLLTAGLAAIAGLVYTARFSGGNAQAGEPSMLDSIAAVVIGGTSLFGGEGSIPGTVIGALIIAVIQFGLVFINVAPFWQFVAVGAVIVLAVVVDQSRRGVAANRG